MKHIKFLKFYFWIMVILFPVLLWLDVTDGEFKKIIDYLDYVFWFIALSGVFCYAYSKSFLTNYFWRLFLPFVIVWDSYIIFDLIKNESEIFPEEIFMISVVLTCVFYFLIVLPQYIAIYLYGYKKNA